MVQAGSISKLKWHEQNIRKNLVKSSQLYKSFCLFRSHNLSEQLKLLLTFNKLTYSLGLRHQTAHYTHFASSQPLLVANLLKLTQLLNIIKS